MDQATILLIDDSIEDLRILVRMLRSVGYRLIISSDPHDGFSRAAAFCPDLILLDVRMPNADGFSVCRRLKASRITADIPVIFLTAACNLEDRLEGLRVGGVDYISKPALPEEVLLRIGIHLMYRERLGQNHDESRIKAFERAGEDPDRSLAQSVIQVMEQDLSSNISINELATMVGSNRKRLSEAFKRLYGCTPISWLRERKMFIARRWLAETRMSIQSIAEALGYNSPANFATGFKERFGLSPSEYRLQHTDNKHAKQQATASSRSPTVARWPPNASVEAQP